MAIVKAAARRRDRVGLRSRRENRRRFVHPEDGPFWRKNFAWSHLIPRETKICSAVPTHLPGGKWHCLLTVANCARLCYSLPVGNQCNFSRWSLPRGAGVCRFLFQSLQRQCLCNTRRQSSHGGF